MNRSAIPATGQPRPRQPQEKSPERLEWERDKAEVTRITNERVRIWLDKAIRGSLECGDLRPDHTVKEFRDHVRQLLASRPCLYTEAEFEAAIRPWSAA
jgi:hypothetical protein